MYKKLINYNELHYAEVDPVRLKRKAVKLHDEIKKIPINHDPYSFYSKTLPFVDAAIRGDISAS